MREHIQEIRGRDAELVVVGNGAPHFARSFREDFDLDGPLLVDPDLVAYRAAGLRRGRVELLSPRLPGSALRALASGARQAGVQGDPWQLGGVFVIRPGGELVYRHVSGDAGDHPPVEEILDALVDPRRRVDEDVPASRAAQLLGRGLGRLVDPLIVPSFDRTGFRIHSLAFDPGDLAVDLAGRRCVVTGANSGIGFETALALADLGADVVLVCRDEGRGREALERIREATGSRRVSLERADVSDLASVRALADRLGPSAVDVLVHNAGVLPDDRRTTADGLELAFATHVAGPFLLTMLLRSRLEASPDARVVWVSSGGMYTRRLRVDDCGWRERDYDGVTAYAETKRAQVVLAEMWAQALAGTGVVVNAMHPGWADTPAVRSSLPAFHRVMRRVLRTPAEGADTVVWLAASERGRERSGELYFDREPRRKHLLPWTRESAADRSALWALCERLTRAGRQRADADRRARGRR